MSNHHSDLGLIDSFHFMHILFYLCMAIYKKKKKKKNWLGFLIKKKCAISDIPSSEP